MKWKHPSTTKIYEALGAVADGRVVILGNSAKVYSSSGNKFYNIEYDPTLGAIMSNDNSSYWQGTLGYPAIAFLLQTGILEYKSDLSKLLSGVKWKDINQKFKNDFDKALDFVLQSIDSEKVDQLGEYVKRLELDIKNLDLSLLGPKVRPPAGY